MSDDTVILDAALRGMSQALDDLVSACLTENGQIQAPSSKAIAKARGYLPPYCDNAFPKPIKAPK